MRTLTSKFMIFGLILLLAMGALAGCAGGAEEAESAGAPAETTEGTTEEAQEATTLEGAVIVDGSGTVYPLMAHIAEEYMVNEQPDVSVQVGRAGSSAGFKKFIPGETDFSDASRKIKDKEVAQLEEKRYETWRRRL